MLLGRKQAIIVAVHENLKPAVGECGKMEFGHGLHQITRG